MIEQNHNLTGDEVEMLEIERLIEAGAEALAMPAGTPAALAAKAYALAQLIRFEMSAESNGDEAMLDALADDGWIVSELVEAVHRDLSSPKGSLRKAGGESTYDQR